MIGEFKSFVICFCFSTELKSAIPIYTMAKIIPTKPLLVLLYGFPGAGKTYFARQLCEHIQAAHLQADRIRAELFENPRNDRQENEVVTQLMEYMTTEFLNAGLSVVYDANALRASQRRQLRDLARKCHAQPLLIWLQIDVESAFNRGLKRDRRRADDKYALTYDRSSFDTIGAHMQNPTMAEDYCVVSGKHVFTTQYSAVTKKMREIGLLSLDDAGTGVVKPGLVNLVPNPAAGRVDMTRRNIVIR